jgi:hypothetical protein
MWHHLVRREIDGTRNGCLPAIFASCPRSPSVLRKQVVEADWLIARQPLKDPRLDIGGLSLQWLSSSA